MLEVKLRGNFYFIFNTTPHRHGFIHDKKQLHVDDRELHLSTRVIVLSFIPAVNHPSVQMASVGHHRRQGEKIPPAEHWSVAAEFNSFLAGNSLIWKSRHARWVKIKLAEHKALWWRAARRMDKNFNLPFKLWAPDYSNVKQSGSQQNLSTTVNIGENIILKQQQLNAEPRRDRTKRLQKSPSLWDYLQLTVEQLWRTHSLTPLKPARFYSCKWFKVSLTGFVSLIQRTFGRFMS